MQDFFGSLDCFHGHLAKAEEFRAFRWSPPFVRCVPRGDDLDIQYATDVDRPLELVHFLTGVIQQVAVSVFSVNVVVEGLHMEEVKENQEIVSNFVGGSKRGGLATPVVDLLFRVSVKPDSAAAPVVAKVELAKLLNRHPEKLSQVKFDSLFSILEIM